MTIVSPPTLAGFTSFITNQMKIPGPNMPDGGTISTAYQLSVEIVNLLMNVVSPPIYVTMVYNLGGHIIVETTQDGFADPDYRDGMPFWTWLRSKYELTSFVGGTVQSASDEGTSESLNVPENLTKLTLADLNYLKTPWGRVYAQYAEWYGSIVGVT